MANWKDSINKVTQSAITKSKEVAETTRLNVEINTLTQKIKDLYAKAGEWVLENGAPSEDPVVTDLASQLSELKQSIEADREKIRAIKNVNVCPNCGAEVSKESRFCEKCGTEIVRASAPASAPEEPANVCVACGKPLEKGVLYCGYCGAKQTVEPEAADGQPGL